MSNVIGSNGLMGLGIVRSATNMASLGCWQRNIYRVQDRCRQTFAYLREVGADWHRRDGGGSYLPANWRDRDVSIAGILWYLLESTKG